MPYRKTGFISVPRSTYIPQSATRIINAFGDNFDQYVSECIKSLGHERVFLKNFFFERILLLNHVSLNGQDELKLDFMDILADFLQMTGYIGEVPRPIDYITDPVMTADELLDRALGVRMPKYSAADIGGEYATIDTLSVFFAEVIRRNALVLIEKKPMIQRFRQWIGNIGFKLLQGSDSISQMERSMFVVYSSTKKRTKGYIRNSDSTPIPAVENKDILVTEVGELVSAQCLPGPCTNHFKLVSNAILEQLLFYYGPHVTDLRSSVGYVRTYGPYSVFEMTPEDTVQWLLESQITGLSSVITNLSVKATSAPPFSLRVPVAVTEGPALMKHRSKESKTGMLAAYPDDPSFRLILTDQTNVANFEWDYYSAWRGRRINSLVDGGTMDYALCDAAVKSKVGGGMQVEQTELTAFGICRLLPNAEAKMILGRDDEIIEEYILPGESGLEKGPVIVTAYYAKMGNVQLLPAFSEYLHVPLNWFMQPAPRMVDFISSVKGLTLEQRVKFTPAIAICHNCAKYKRLTKKDPPFDKMELIRTLLFPRHQSNK